MGRTGVFHISTKPIYRGFWTVYTGFSTVSTWFSTFPQWNPVENLCKTRKTRPSPTVMRIFCVSFKVASYAVHFFSPCYTCHKRKGGYPHERDDTAAEGPQKEALDRLRGHSGHRHFKQCFPVSFSVPCYPRSRIRSDTDSGSPDLLLSVPSLADGPRTSQVPPAPDNPQALSSAL